MPEFYAEKLKPFTRYRLKVFVVNSDNSYNSGGDWTNSDKSSNFEYGLSDNRRKEVADESGNVRGQVKLGME